MKEQGVGWAERAKGENWDNCNRITIKNGLTKLTDWMRL